MTDTPLPDDHREKWVYKKHTRAKHEVLHYYLKVWTSIVSHDNYNLTVFDCFAGRGDYVGSDGAEPISLDNISSDADYPGSPILILDSLAEHSDKFNKAECHFMEPTLENRENLKEVISNTRYPGNVNPHIHSNSFPGEIRELLQNFRRGRDFAFFFIDPFNIKYLDHDMITEISGTGRVDCLITVMTSQLIRWQDSHSHHEGYSRFFGVPDWREKIEQFQPEELTTREAEFYCNRLEENGPEYTLAYMTTDGDTRELKYHLVFTTNDLKGVEAMKESMMRCGGDYSLAYAPARAELSHEQQIITGGKFLKKEERSKAWLLSRFAGEEITFDQICQRALTERRYEQELRKDYRQYLKDLHNSGEVNIPDRNSPEGPLPDDLTITFPEVNSS